MPLGADGIAAHTHSAAVATTTTTTTSTEAATTTRWTRSLHPAELVAHRLASIFKNLDQLTCMLGVLNGEEGVGSSTGASAACPTDPMYIVLHLRRKVIV